jgi:hypothetical protein
MASGELRRGEVVARPRLLRRTGAVTPETLAEIERALALVLGLDANPARGLVGKTLISPL